MKHTEAAEEIQVKSDVTLMHFLSRGLLTIFRLKRIVVTVFIYSAIFNLNETCTDEITVA